MSISWLDRGSVMIVGATGLIGGAIGQLLNHLGVPVDVMLRSNADIERINFKPRNIFIGTVMDKDAFIESIKGADFLLYFASTSIPGNSNVDLNREIYISLPAIYAVVDAISKENLSIRLVFPSSGGAIYGERSTPANEETIVNPTGAYAFGKIVSEKIIGFYNKIYSINSEILRITNVYGSNYPRNAAQGAIDRWLDDAISGEVSTVWSDLETARDYIFIDDVAKAILSVMMIPPSGCRIFNVGSGSTNTLSDVLKTINTCTNGKHRFVSESVSYPGIMRSSVDISKIVESTGWRPTIDLEEGIKESWRRKNRFYTQNTGRRI